MAAVGKTASRAVRQLNGTVSGGLAKIVCAMLSNFLLTAVDGPESDGAMMF